MALRAAFVVEHALTAPRERVDAMRYERERVLHDAAEALGSADVDAFLLAMRRCIGAP